MNRDKFNPSLVPLMTSGLEWSGPILKGKDIGDINKKGKYKQEIKEVSYNKQKEAGDKVNKRTIYIMPKSTMSRAHLATVPTRGLTADAEQQ